MTTMYCHNLMCARAQSAAPHYRCSDDHANYCPMCNNILKAEALVRMQAQRLTRALRTELSRVRNYRTVVGAVMRGEKTVEWLAGPTFDPELSAITAEYARRATRAELTEACRTAPHPRES